MKLALIDDDGTVLSSADTTPEEWAEAYHGMRQDARGEALAMWVLVDMIGLASSVSSGNPATTDIALTANQLLRISRVNLEVTRAISGDGDLIRSATSLVSIVNVLILPPHLQSD